MHLLCQNLGKYLLKKPEVARKAGVSGRESEKSSKNVPTPGFDLLGFPELAPHRGDSVRVASFLGQVSGWHLRKGLVSKVKDGKNRGSYE